MESTVEWIRNARKAAVLSQAELAAKCNVTQAQVSQWVAGRAEPSDEMLKKLEKALDARSAAVTVTQESPTASESEESRRSVQLPGLVYSYFYSHFISLNFTEHLRVASLPGVAKTAMTSHV